MMNTNEMDASCEATHELHEAPPEFFFFEDGSGKICNYATADVLESWIFPVLPPWVQALVYLKGDIWIIHDMRPGVNCPRGEVIDASTALRLLLENGEEQPECLEPYLRANKLGAVSTVASGESNAPTPDALDAANGPTAIRGGAEQGGTVAIQKALAVYTSGASDVRIEQVAAVLGGEQSVNDKLNSMNKLIPIPATTSARDLGKALGVSHQAVKGTQWWKKNRAGQRESTAQRRLEQHQRRAEEA